jgi:hypothetical protein
MDEQARSEGELSEEQLREISGGCGQCLKDLSTANRLQRAADGYLKKVINAVEDGKYRVAQGYLKSARGTAKRAQGYLDEVRARGHALPDLNQPLPGAGA